MTSKNKPQAVIYARVSDVTQTIGADGLRSQEAICREYARHRGYRILHVFSEDVSGKEATRTEFERMLRFVKAQRGSTTAIIIDDISRLARDVETHWQLRRRVMSAGGELISPSFAFEENADGRLIENVLAGAAQHQREKNGEQTRKRMRGRLMNGYWVFHAPLGYRYTKHEFHGKILVPDEPVASTIKAALNGFASGRFGSQSDVKRFFEADPHFPKCTPKGEVRFRKVADILSRKLYAGLVDQPSWSIPPVTGKHEALISVETYRKIQDKIAKGANVAARKDIATDFPLRGYVSCVSCGRAMTACWSHGRSKQYPYYWCNNKTCDLHRKSHSAIKMHAEFEDLLQTVQPTQNLIGLAHELFKSIWDARSDQAKETKRALAKELKALEAKMEGLLDRLIEAGSPTIAAAFEKRIAKLEEEKLLLQEKLANCGQTRAPFADMFEHACAFLQSPIKLWNSNRLEDKRAVLKLVFGGKIAYAKDKGFRTAETTLPFKVLGGFLSDQKSMVPPHGVPIILNV